MDFKKQIEDIMIMVENLSVKLHPENPITHNDYKVEEQTPHEWPKELPKGYCAVYFYAHNDMVLKIGKANEKSKSRYTSQHYRFNAPSTLAKSLYENSDYKFKNKEEVKPWMLENLHRINILIKADDGYARTELIESLLHYHFRPRYEGAINFHKKKKTTL